MAFIFFPQINRIQQESLLAAVPSQPPPPYTPPATPPPSARVPPKPAPKFVPTSKDPILSLCQTITSAFFERKSTGVDLKEDEAFVAELVAMCDEKDVHKGAKNVYVRFLIDLVGEIAAEVFKCEAEAQNPPWMPQKPLARQRLLLPRNPDHLWKVVCREVLVYFGHEKRVAKENLIVRWSHKKRDRVDQILVRELHGEEAAWVDYSVDEAVVKDQLGDAILDLLVKDTVKHLKKVCRKKRLVDA